jgi:hypothetical protein
MTREELKERTTQFALRVMRPVGSFSAARALECADMSALSKAATCRRTPKRQRIKTASELVAIMASSYISASRNLQRRMSKKSAIKNQQSAIP